MTEYESERERLAMLMDLQLRLKQLEKEVKTSFTSQELFDAIIEVAQDIKQHK